MLSFLFLVLLAHACSVRPQELLQKNIFILAGQSNMAGRGGVFNNTLTDTINWDGIVPPQCRPNPSVLRLSAKLTWVEAHEPLHADIDVNKINGIGPGMAFANAVLAKDFTLGVVGLVPCAIGGTNISEWGRGTFLYKQLVRRAQASLQNGGMIRALLWYQGESDTVSREDAKLYKGKLEKFFVDLRADLQSPMLSIVQVALASGEGHFIERVREAQLGIDLLNVQCVDAKGLPLEPDGLHLTTAAQVKLGDMLADAFLQSLPISIPISSQSNMAGRGGVTHGKWDSNIPPECKSNPSILRLNAQLKWEVAHEPLHADIDVGKACGVGPGMAFANEVRAKGYRIGVVGLVPCAVGGTRISEWVKGTRLYGELVRRANESLKEGGVIRAILWYQGESDTVRRRDAEGYKGNMERLIRDLRSDLDRPSLLVIQVALASGEGKFIETVRKAQLEINITNVKCLDAKGLKLEADHLHLTSISEVHLGLKLAHAFLASYGHLLY